MKLLIAALAVSFAGSFAHAAESTNICDRFMTCGTYVAPRDQSKEDSYEVKIVIASTGPMTATFDYIMTNKDGKVSTWPLQATFTEEGVATMRWEGKEVYATAICALRLCNYALVPFENEKHGIWGNAGLMRFTGTTLEFMMTVGTPRQFRSNGMIMQKQP